MLNQQQITSLKASNPTTLSGGSNPGAVYQSPEAAKAAFSSNPTSQNSSQDSFKSTIDNSPLKQSFNAIGNAGSDYLKGVGSDYQSAAQAITADPTQGKGGVASIPQVLNQGLDVAAKTTGAVLSPITRAISPVLSPIVNAAGNAINKIPGATDMLNHVNELIDKHPDASKDLGNLFQTFMNVAGAMGSEEAAPKVASAVSDGLDKTGSVIGDTTSVLKDKIVGTSKSSPSTPPVDINGAIKDATPSYNKNMVGEPAIKNADGTATPRIQPGKGLTGSRTVTPTPLEVAAGNELIKVPGYKTGATALDNFNAVQPELAARGKSLSISLQSENILRPPKEIVSVIKKGINQATDESLLLSKKDPVIKTYLSTANRIINANDGTLAGELKVRQQLDSAYKNARGNSAFGSDRISALDEIHTAARNALNNDIAENAKSTDVKSSLKADSALYRAQEVLRNKAEAEGNSKIDQLMKSYPKVTKAAMTVAKGVGMGAVVDHIIP